MILNEQTESMYLTPKHTIPALITASSVRGEQKQPELMGSLIDKIK